MRSINVQEVLLVSCLCIVAAGCTGQLVEPTGSNPGSNPNDPRNPNGPSNPNHPTNPNDPNTKPPFDPAQCAPPPSRIVRLSKLEIQNSIADLLGTARSVELPDDAKFLNFSSNAEALVTSPFGNALKSTAEALAADFRASVKAADFGSTCTSSDASARSCATTFIDIYGKKAFRRPLEPAEVDGLLAVYDAGRETGIDGDVQDRFKAGLDYTLRALLQSPDFVYRVELGDSNGAVDGVTSLSPHEVASSLAYLITASPPDETLLTAAAEGRLASPEALEAQARRLLREMPERFAARERRFVREWLGIDLGSPAWDKNTAVYPLFSPALKSAIDQETDLYLDDWVTQGPTLTSLLTRSDTFVNSVNAPLYGLTAGPGPMTRVALDPQQRSGILTMPAFLGTLAHGDSSSPILRGVNILRQVMCLTIPAPPPNVPQLPPVTDTAFTTTRDRVEQHVASGSCSNCHGKINPIGYPFESYDGLGVYRTSENGYPVDASGAIVGTTSSDQPVKNAIELTRALLGSPEVQECFSRQVFRNAFGRQDAARDECTVRDATAAYKAEALDARELLVSLIKSQTFAKRSVVSP
jgi:hypothetical protein